MIKNREYLIPVHPLKFNSAQIQFNSDGIVQTKESYERLILSVIDYIADFTNSKEITRKKLSPKKEHLSRTARGAYIASLYQLETSFNLFQTAQIVEFSTNGIAILNKRLQ